ncbi:MAG: hypothetical protein VXW32_07405 [Myxococcota bacterium]|nr:hypothetical protein [Myxococcota bacterium]
MKFRLGISLWLLAACQSEPLPGGEHHFGRGPSLSAGQEELVAPGTGPEDSEEIDLFRSRPDTSEGLINASFDLLEVLEFGALEGACEAYAENRGNRRLKLLCGKSMFFYEGFGTEGIPKPLIDWMSRNFPDELGLGFSKLGLVMDPYRSTPDQPRHLGVGEGALMGRTSTLALTCASCHFGRMPDGRYAVGYPNLEYEYGTHILSLFIGSMRGVPGFRESDHHPDAIDVVRPVLDRFDADPMLAMGLMWDMLPMLLGGVTDIPRLSTEAEGFYASWLPGTMDFAMAPLPLEDGVHTVSKILPVWGIPRAREMQAHGMDSAMLAWTGAAKSLDEFLAGFVVVGGGPSEEWGEPELAPLKAFIESLDAPEPLELQDPEAVASGAEVFREAGCQDCHAGPRGGGLEVFDLEEIGTDPAIGDWGDGDGDGEICCGIDGDLTGGIKAPRLDGLFALNAFLHNGSLGSLEELLCVEEREQSLSTPHANTGHRFGCDLELQEKSDLLAFLRSN